VATGDYFSWRVVRLKSTHEWTQRGEGLSFIFPRSGVGKYNSREASRSLAPGDVLVMSTSAQHSLAAPANRELEFGYFCLCPEDLFPLFTAHELGLLHSIFNSLVPRKWYPAVSQLATECHRLLKEISPHFDVEHRAQLLKVAAHLLSAEFKIVCGAKPELGANRHIAKVLGKISVNELIRVSVEELARRFSCSRRHLNRLFRKYYGHSVNSLKMEIRLIKAVSLLRQPDAKIINVAEQCGFNHLGLFNQYFKRRFGTSPGHWRNLRLSGDKVTNGFPSGDVTCALRLNGLCPWNDNDRIPCRSDCSGHNLGPCGAVPNQQYEPGRKTIFPNTRGG
jgi:AraC-like DNA-binding protein